MTEEEIKAIETHTEIHTKAEPRAIKITEILRKAVRELRENKHLKEEMEIMTNFCGACKKKHEEENNRLEGQISLLLSCKDCPENKGGYICEKEYNDKCLSQKIQYIKELKEELAKMTSVAEHQQDCNMKRGFKLEQTRKIIKEFVDWCNRNFSDCDMSKGYHKMIKQAEQFLKEET